MMLELHGTPRAVFIVKSYEQCRAFYEQYFELRIDCEWDRGPGTRGVVYELGTMHLELLEGQQDPLNDNIYLYIPVKDIDALWEQLSRVAKVIVPIANQEWGHRNFTIHDPAGSKLKFFSEVAEDTSDA